MPAGLSTAKSFNSLRYSQLRLRSIGLNKSVQSGARTGRVLPILVITILIQRLCLDCHRHNQVGRHLVIGPMRHWIGFALSAIARHRPLAPKHLSGQGGERQSRSKSGLRSISLKDRSCFKDGLSSMNLRYRSFHPRDATACQQLLQRYPEYSPQVFAALPTFWKRLFDEQAIIAAVIEDCQPGMPGTIVAFGADVFVTDGFMAEARAGCEPGIVYRLIRGELYDKLTPILRLDAIARANAGAGLNVIIIHNGLPELPTSVSMQAIGFKFQEAFTWAHRGYRIKEILHEVWDETDREWVRALHRLRADYSDFYGQSLCVPGVRPYLFGITREEAFENTGSITAPLFWYTPPRFQFRQ